MVDMTELWAKLIDNALTLAALAIAVWWLQKVLSQFISKLDQERKERLDSMQAEIEMQRRRNDECERDRADIHRQLLELYTRTVALPAPRE